MAETPPKCAWIDLPVELFDKILELCDRDSLLNVSSTSRAFRGYIWPLLWKNIELVDCSTQLQNFHDVHDDTAIIKKLYFLATHPNTAKEVQTIEYRCHLPPPHAARELPNVCFEAEFLSRTFELFDLIRLAVAQLQNVHSLFIVFGHWHFTRELLQAFFWRKGKPSSVRRLWIESSSINGVTDLLDDEMDLSKLESLRLRRTTMFDWRVLEHRMLVAPYMYEMARTSREGNRQLSDGYGSTFFAKVNYFSESRSPAAQWEDWSAVKHEGKVTTHAGACDERIWRKLPEIRRYIAKNCSPLPAGTLTNDESSQSPETYWRERHTSAISKMREGRDSLHFSSMMRSAAGGNLTSLNLDWLLINNWDGILGAFDQVTFPNLRAFQLRGALVGANVPINTMLPPGTGLTDLPFSTMMPRGIYLLDESDGATSPFIGFLERHDKLECLAWPMDGFFSNIVCKETCENFRLRSKPIIAKLARTLLDLRVDTEYEDRLEPKETDIAWFDGKAARRRRFIQEFASLLGKVRSLKMEGWIPRDERRETVRALSACPLEKIVMLGGSTWPMGNTWGERARWLPERDYVSAIYRDLRGSDYDFGLVKSPLTIYKPYCRRVSDVGMVQEPAFRAKYGWDDTEKPLLHQIAAGHSGTVRYLKMAGLAGAPLALGLAGPEFSDTHVILSGLSHFHRLKYLCLSTWLTTSINSEFLTPVIQYYWGNLVAQPHEIPHSLAISSKGEKILLTCVEMAAVYDWRDREGRLRSQPDWHNPIPEPSVATGMATILADDEWVWIFRLRTTYSPKALAWRVSRLIGRHLSPVAKAQEDGVFVRATFSLREGTNMGELFDLDLRIRPGASPLQDEGILISGPMTVMAKERRKQKLETRSWF